MKTMKALILAGVLMPALSYADGFRGAYVGGTVGFGTAQEKGTGYNIILGGIPSGYTHDTIPKGALLGLNGGYSWLVSNRIQLGVQAEYDIRSNNDSAFQKNLGVVDTGFKKETSLKASAALLARAGLLVSPRTLLYVNAGVSNIKVSRQYESVGTSKETHGGWQRGYAVGFGAEHLLTRNLAAGVEYRYANYGTDKVTVDMWNEFYKERLRDQSLRFGVSYRF